MTNMAVRSIVFLLAATLAGCSYTIRIPAYHVPPEVQANHFIAGAGETEITPEVGIPMGGHGPGGRIARGYWMRLYARAFYFQDREGHVLAFVSCDLFAMPAGLRSQILEIVNTKESLNPDSLIISATHTHHGPGNFASSELYNSFASPLPNFDRTLFHFLADRIADAVVTAIRDAQSHRDELSDLRFYDGSATGIQRNRAIAPFFQNDSSTYEAILKESKDRGSLCPDGSATNCPRYFAVDPSLKLLQVTRNGRPCGLLVFYAVHPTAMTHDSELYSGDLSGVAMRLLEKDGEGVVGYFNGAEGDVSPDWTQQDRDDVLRLGEKLTSMALHLLHETRPRIETDPVIEIRWNRVPNNWRAGPAETGFAKTPLAGAAEIGGAEDGRTIFYNYGWRPENRKDESTGDQGTKEPGLDEPLADAFRDLDWNLMGDFVAFIKPTHIFAPAKTFPKEVPVATARLLNFFSVAAVPVEPTTVVGRSIREGLKVDVVIGLANEYIGYTTTAAEYSLQQYEGASTLLGPKEAATLVYLLQTAQNNSSSRVTAESFRAGPARSNRFGPSMLLVRKPRNMVDEDLEPLVPRRLRWLESRIPRFEWTEDADADWQTYKRHVTVYAKGRGQFTYTEIDMDSDFNFLTVLEDGRTSDRRYAALWFPPESSETGTSYYFQINTARGQILCSDFFQLEDLKPQAPVRPIPASTNGVCTH
jgi:neutral ceramidase